MIGQLENIGEKILLAGAYGDAAGLPVEYLAAADIRDKFGYVYELMPSNHHPMFEDEDGVVYSDDTQGMMAVVNGLKYANGFDLSAQAEAHLEVYDRVPRIEWEGRKIARGWGTSTINAMERLMDGVGPESSGEVVVDGKGGAGNAVLTKLAPLVFWQLARGLDSRERYDQYDQLTTMTHDTDVARLATRIHGDFLCYLANVGPGVASSWLAEVVADNAAVHEVELGTDGETTEILRYLTKKNIAKKIENDPDQILEYTDGKGFYAPQTLAMAYGAFIIGNRDFATSVYRAVNLGGDTDSVASIVANLCNFSSNGEIRIPGDAYLIKDKYDLKLLGRELASLALRGAR